MQAVSTEKHRLLVINCYLKGYEEMREILKLVLMQESLPYSLPT